MEGVRIHPEAAGSRLHLRVVPGAKADEVVGPFGDRLRVRVRAVAERGKANRAVIALLAGALGIAANRIEIVAGQGSRDKAVLIRGLDPETVRMRLSGR